MKPSLNNAKALIDGDILVYRIGFASNDDEEKFAIARMSNFIDKLLSLIPGGVFGLLSVIIILIGDFIAFAYFPGYSIFNNTYKYGSILFTFI